ncbi:hypothetical protein AHAS_Ahas03G0186500 [Arachis hypogaea]
MQHDYDCVCDVLAFDSTDRKTLYNRPMVIFSGSNHHRQTIIFGFGLFEDEKIPSYKLLLRSFLNVMRKKESKVFWIRYEDLGSACMSMCFLASQDAEMYENALAQVSKMSKEIEAVCPRGESGRPGRVEVVQFSVDLEALSSACFMFSQAPGTMNSQSQASGNKVREN